MRLVRVQVLPRKVVIYHATWQDLRARLLCVAGHHDYALVREYPRVGAREEMCLHCLKPRYSITPPVAATRKVA